MSAQQLWTAFTDVYNSYNLSTHTLSISTDQRLENPFIVNYAVYHHYRALGWVVKNGIKFCVDFLLYRRGPVFNHAEYAPFTLYRMLC